MNKDGKTKLDTDKKNIYISNDKNIAESLYLLSETDMVTQECEEKNNSRRIEIRRT